jgi:hypothetical protein
MSVDLEIPQLDKGYTIDFTVQTSTGGARDLSGYTVKLRVWKAGVPGTLIVDGTCTGASTDGTCSYTLTGTDFVNIAKPKGELELIKAGVVESTEPFDIKVGESGGGST